MTTARSSATSASSRIHPIGVLFPYAAATAVVALAAACTIIPIAPLQTLPPSESRLRAVAFTELPGWNDDAQAAAWMAFIAQCPTLLAQPAATPIWRDACNAALLATPDNDAAARAFFEMHFTPYSVSAPDGRDTGLVTGYYEPLLRGSRHRDDRYRYPLYAPPDDLLRVELFDLFPELEGKRVRGRLDGRRVVPYWTRADIEAGRAPLAGKELVWVDDAIDAFFLHIQGSGRVTLKEGDIMRIGYADQNGQPFQSIGRLLVERGELTLASASMQTIKQWGRDHPDKLASLLAENPSYVFFREVVPDPKAAIDGPIGSLGVPLLAQRTIAVDPRAIPLGTPVYLATTYPLSEKPLARLVMAQDTGGAIKGALRADLFWGFGESAGEQAGRMRQQGKMWLLWPKGARPPM
ncbi:MAG: transglycosylase [Betaproteobacteria bacterium]|nr:MAG: transglycosylase [Betaproteobacteria bacterium]